MPNMQTAVVGGQYDVAGLILSEPAAILVSDIHLSHTAPRARQHEPDWYEAMARPLHWLAALRAELDVPIICAGDIFHTWNPPPRLINFAIDHLPQMYAIPGNHDLPGHSLQRQSQSAYATLVRAGKITPLISESMGEVIEILEGCGHLRIIGVPYGDNDDVVARTWPVPADDCCNVLVSHKYVHNGGATTYDPEHSGRVSKLPEGYNRWHVAHFGDNHHPFQKTRSGTHLVNTGAFLRRTVTDTNYSLGCVVVTLGGDTGPDCYRVTYEDPDEQCLQAVITDDHLAGHQLDGLVRDFLEGVEVSSMSRDWPDLLARFFHEHPTSPAVQALVMEHLGV